MKNNSSNKEISAEVLAAFLDGNATENEIKKILSSIGEDSGLRELMNISRSVDKELGMAHEEIEILPMASLAAACDEHNYCCLMCEKYILEQRNIVHDEKKMIEDANKHGWQKDRGTALHNIGRHLEKAGLAVKRRYNCTIDDITGAINKGEYIIAAVDSGELNGDFVAERLEDIYKGEKPDHAVVVLSVDTGKRTVTIFDPASAKKEDTYPIERFIDAWNDSKSYMVTVPECGFENYVPDPIDLSGIELDESLMELREAISENAHEVWAAKRKKEGWSYGPYRDDINMKNPCMVPYSLLSEEEKDTDRQTAMDTLKLMKKLGYDIIKKEDTALYCLLKERMLNAGQDYRCPECGNPVYKGQVWCDHCRHELRLYWKKILID